MIAWHDLGPDEAAAVRADLAQWVDQVLFPLFWHFQSAERSTTVLFPGDELRVADTGELIVTVI